MAHKPRKRDPKTGRMPPLTGPGPMLAEWLVEEEEKLRGEKKPKLRKRPAKPLENKPF